MADGSIIFDTALDESGFAADAKKLEKSSESLTKKLNKITAAQQGDNASKSGLKKLAEQATAAQYQVEELEGQLKALGNTPVKTEEYWWLEKELDKAKTALLKYQDQELFLQRMGVDEHSAQWRRLQLLIQDAQDQIREYTAEMAYLKQGGKDTVMGSQTEQFKELKGKIAAAKEKVAEYTAEMEKARAATDEMGKSVKKSGNQMGGLEKRLVSLARRVLVFGIITKGLRAFRDYLGKALKTSKEFTAAWNNLRGALLTAFQPIWETILPWLTKFINVLAKVITWVAAFFSWLTGKSLAASSKNAKNLYKEANAIEVTGKAADKAKLSLAAFDEINNLSSNKDTGNGGGSSGVTTPTFEVDTSYLEKVEGIMKKIGGWVLAIAAGLGAWKIARAFGADLKKCIGWFMTISGLVLGITGFLDAWNEGLNWDNLIQILTGAALFAGGLAVLFGKVGGAIGLIIDGIALIVIGIKEWVEQGELTDQAFVAIEAGIIAIGAALALLISPWALVVAAIAGVALAVYKYWDEISAFFKGVWEKISAFFVGIWEKVKDIFAPVIQWFSDNIITPLVTFFEGMGERIAAVFEGCWIIIQAVWKIVSEWFDQNVIQPVVAFFKKLGEDISRIFKEAWEVIKPIWNAVAGWFNQHVIQPIVKFFTSAWDKIKNAFVTAFEAISAFAKSIFNSVISMVEGIVNRVIKAINGIIGGFNKVVTWAAGVIGKDWGGVALLPEVHLPRLAEGTVVPANREFLAMLGDNKRETEIVSPLSTMKQALKEALKESGMGGNMNVQVFLDGQKVYDSVVDYSKRDIRRTGRYPILGE